MHISLPHNVTIQYYCSLASSRVVSPHSCSGVVWTHLSKQQSLTVEPSSRCSSPTSVSGLGGAREKQKYLTKQKSLSSACAGPAGDKATLTIYIFPKNWEIFSSAKPSCSSPAYGSSRFLPKQYSCNSNSSAYLSPQVEKVIKEFWSEANFYISL